MINSYALVGPKNPILEGEQALRFDDLTLTESVGRDQPQPVPEHVGEAAKGSGPHRGSFPPCGARCRPPDEELLVLGTS
jgi:hypothetical protein